MQKCSYRKNENLIHKLFFVGLKNEKTLTQTLKNKIIMLDNECKYVKINALTIIEDMKDNN